MMNALREVFGWDQKGMFIQLLLTIEPDTDNRGQLYHRTQNQHSQDSIVQT